MKVPVSQQELPLAKVEEALDPQKGQLQELALGGVGGPWVAQVVVNLHCTLALQGTEQVRPVAKVEEALDPWQRQLQEWALEEAEDPWVAQMMGNLHRTLALQVTEQVGLGLKLTMVKAV
jgi:hypothetical protein